MQGEKYEVALVSFARALTRSTRTFSSLDEALVRAELLNEEIDQTEFPSAGWIVRYNPNFKKPTDNAD